MNRTTSMFRSFLLRARLAALATFALAAAVPAQGLQPILPPGCEALQVDPGHRATLRLYARGVQVYRFDAAEAKWTFTHPYALLHADPGCQSPIGFHNGGPTWWTFSGSMVVGRKLAEATVDPASIPWLLLEAIDTEGPGVFKHTTFIQRVATVGGRAPAQPGAPGQIALVPYTAEYVFYRGR
ncbi:MAG: DUF3455 domain-containing protein [Planctomycetes bacterium]|nr:DUF3455 domain-containing protein [Planctomycetota bacterium]